MGERRGKESASGEVERWRGIYGRWRGIYGGRVWYQWVDRVGRHSL